MKLSVTGRHLDVADAVRTRLERKLRPLERVLNDDLISAQIVVSREREAYICDVTIHARGGHALHGVGRDARATVAAGAAADRVIQQAHKLADRWRSRRRDGRKTSREATPEPRTPAPAARRAAPTRPRVIRARSTELKPMTLDDAAFLLSSGDQPVLVFRQATSERVAVLFRRPDGHFGLIEPEA